MKKLLVIVLMFIGFTQLQAQTRFGAQVNVSTSSAATFGIGGHAEIFLNDQMSIQPAFDYYFSKESAPGVSVSYWAINGDFHYYFTDDSPKFYGIGGLSYFNSNVSISGGGYVYSGAGSTFGVNIGAGASFGAPFAELKYNSPLAGLVVTVGYRFGGN